MCQRAIQNIKITKMAINTSEGNNLQDVKEGGRSGPFGSYLNSKNTLKSFPFCNLEVRVVNQTKLHQNKFIFHFKFGFFRGSRGKLETHQRNTATLPARRPSAQHLLILQREELKSSPSGGGIKTIKTLQNRQSKAKPRTAAGNCPRWVGEVKYPKGDHKFIRWSKILKRQTKLFERWFILQNPERSWKTRSSIITIQGSRQTLISASSFSTSDKETCHSTATDGKRRQ